MMRHSAAGIDFPKSDYWQSKAFTITSRVPVRTGLNKRRAFRVGINLHEPFSGFKCCGNS